MSSLAHTQGGLRPAFAHDATFHPGMQVHAIAEPRGNRRLSLLISFLCYESMAAVVFFTMQHREALQSRFTSPSIINLIEPTDAVLSPRPEPKLTAAPAAIPMAVHDGSTPVARPLDALSEALPQVLPSVSHIGDGAGDNTGQPPVVGAAYGRTSAVPGQPGGSGSAGPVEISMAQVQILHQVEPIYPALARIIKISGDVVVRMTIDTTGHPSEVKVLSGPEQLRGEALRCARQWRFTPARLGGEAVPAAFNLTLRFVLR